MKLFFTLLASLFLSGCVTSRSSISFQDPSFNLEVLKKSPSVIVATPLYITLTDFQKTFEKVYQTNENFMKELVNNLTVSLALSDMDVVADHTPDVYTKIMEDSVKFISSNKAKFVVCMRTVKIDQILKYNMMPIPAGTIGVGMSRQQICKVSIEVVIVDLETKRVLMTFEVSDMANVSFVDYQNTLVRAVEKATRALTNKLLLKQ